jgi:glycosyltransferase involved in cell wall biosynthesis
MRILFASSEKSTASNACNHRVFNIERHCKQLGADTSRLFLGDLFFDSPVFIQLLNLPFILRYLKKFDVIHAGASGAAFFFSIATRFIGRNTIVVYDVHSDAITESRLMPKGKLDFIGYFIEFEILFTEYIALSGTKYFLASSSEIKRRLLERNRKVISRNVEIIVNGVDLAQFTSQKSLDPPVFTATYAGSFGAIESVDTLVRAAEILSNENILFKFIGFSKEDLSIKSDIQKRLGNKALLLDWLPRNELVAELQNSNVLVIPSDSRNRKQAENRSAVFVTKFAEYLAVAKPVIVTKLDITSKIVDSCDCGFVCEANAESIAECIRKAEKTPSTVLQKKGLNGRRFAETELNIDLICKRYLQFLNKLLKQRSSERVLTSAENI